jgi:hypothetical protein
MAAGDGELRGYTAMIRKLNNAIKRMPRVIEAALYAEAQIERTESMKRTPVDTGTLRSTHVVRPPVTQNGNTTVTIAVGGPSAPYAIYVHENLEAQHKSGQAKFLESTLKESAPYMAQRVARRIDLRKLTGE